MKKLTITQRELVRNWVRLKMKLKNGEADQLVIPENGDTYIMSYKKSAPQPGDISAWLDELKKMPPLKGKDRYRLARINWSLKGIKLMERLAKQRKRKS